MQIPRETSEPQAQVFTPDSFSLPPPSQSSLSPSTAISAEFIIF